MTLVLWLAVVLSGGLEPAPSRSIDVKSLRIGNAERIVELDLSQMAGDPRRLSWSPDKGEFYLQTVSDEGPDAIVHHFLVESTGEQLRRVDVMPQWAGDYWAYKSNRNAPGMPEVEIAVTRHRETVRVGTGSAGALDRTSNPLGGSNVMSVDNIERERQNIRQVVVALEVFGETISAFVDRPPVPGVMFGWGPVASGALAFTTRDGELFVLDAQGHKRRVKGARNATLPAWSVDGSHLVWLQKTGRHTFALMVVTTGH